MEMHFRFAFQFYRQLGSTISSAGSNGADTLINATGTFDDLSVLHSMNNESIPSIRGQHP